MSKENKELNSSDIDMVKKYQHTSFIFIFTALLAYLTYLFSTGETPTLGDSIILMISTMTMFGIISFYLKDYYWKLFVKNDQVASQYSEQVKEWIALYETEQMNVIFNNLNEEDQEKLSIYTISVESAKNAFSLMRFTTNTMFPLALLLIVQFYNILLLVQ